MDVMFGIQERRRSKSEQVGAGLLLTTLCCFPFQKPERCRRGRKKAPRQRLTSKIESFCHGMPQTSPRADGGVGVVDARDKSQVRIHPPKAWGPTPGWTGRDERRAVARAWMSCPWTQLPVRIVNSSKTLCA